MDSIREKVVTASLTPAGAVQAADRCGGGDAEAQLKQAHYDQIMSRLRARL
jgi:hypothetical protein